MLKLSKNDAATLIHGSDRSEVAVTVSLGAVRVFSPSLPADGVIIRDGMTIRLSGFVWVVAEEDTAGIDWKTVRSE